MMATLASLACVAIDESEQSGDVREVPSTEARATSPAADPIPSEAAPAETETETAEPPAAVEHATLALTAAGEAFRVSTATECTGEEDCIQPLPSTAETAPYGMATLTYVAAGGGGAIVAMGRDSAGDWGLWLLYQGDDPRVVPLPGQLLVCADTETFELRTEPSADAAAAGPVARQQVLDTDEFVLTDTGGPDTEGAGWYHVTGEVQGWIPAEDIVEASVGSCDAGSNGGGGPVG